MPRLENNIVIGDQDEGVQGLRMSYIYDSLRETGNKTVLVDAVRHKAYTARQLLEEALSLSKGLKRLNVSKGDKVALCCENRFEFATCVFGIFTVNATVAPMNVTYTERELVHALNLSKPKVIIASAFTVDRVVQAKKHCPFVEQIVAIDSNPRIKNTIPYKSLLERIEVSEVDHFQPEPSNPNEDLAIILCSSGTTGLPKGVALSQKNVLCTIARLAKNFNLVGEFNFFTIIPWFHGFGCLTVIASLCGGLNLTFIPKFEEELFLSTIQRYKIDVVYIVPPIVVFLAKHPSVDKYDLSSLKIILCGAAPLSKETEDEVIKRIGVFAVRQGYGLSETTLAVLGQNEEHCKPGSVGSVLNNVSAKVVDIETGKTLGPNERGELCFKGDVVMKGYIGDKKSTNEVIDEDGWLHTGDVGYYDNDLSFFIVDRIKELIKYKAFQVPPAELEALLLTHPKIKDAAVIGLPDEESGELPLAFVVKQPNTKLTEKEVVEFIAERVSPPKRLRGGVQFVSSIPKNPSGKILRRELREKLKKGIKSKL